MTDERSPGAVPGEGRAGCSLCARACLADRRVRPGVCGETDEIRVARAALHMWEEPCISGEEGSGTVFFEGCPLGCVFCQNRVIARGRQGGSGSKAVSERRLAEIFLELEEKGANNINLVTATHYIPQVIRAVRAAREGLPAEEAERADDAQGLMVPAAHNTGSGETADNARRLTVPVVYNTGSCETAAAARRLTVPVVYNTGSYETADAVRSLSDTVDIYLPDLKFFDEELSARYAGARNYFSAASAAIREMVENVRHLPPAGRARTEGAGRERKGSGEKRGLNVYDERGMMTRGVIVRHLVLPGHTKDSKAILRYLYGEYGSDIVISIMNQYTPMPGIEERFPELGRRVTRREYDRVIEYALSLGISEAFIQEGSAASESFIPAFNGEGVTREISRRDEDILT